MLLRPLPVREPERLVNLGAPGPKPGSQLLQQAGDCDEVFSYPMFRDLESEQTRLHRPRGAPRLRREPRLQRPDREAATGMLVSGGYFPVLGLHAGARAGCSAPATTRSSASRTSSC